MPRQYPNRTDRWCTPREIMDLVAEQYGTIDLDPCYDPKSIVAATTRYDIREGIDGLALDWPAGAKVWCNPPYARGQVKRWAAKAAEHASKGGEVLFLINVQTGSQYWRDVIWPNVAAICFATPRVHFFKEGEETATQNLCDSVICYFGNDVEGFARVWSKRGPIVTVHTPQVDKAANTDTGPAETQAAA